MLVSQHMPVKNVLLYVVKLKLKKERFQEECSISGILLK